MQVTELESKGLKKKWQVTIDAAQLNTQMETELRATGERVKLPGFRPGNVPMKILRQRYGKSIEADVIKQAINRATSEALAQKKLRPAMAPQLDLDNYNEDSGLAFTMTFEVLPEITEPAYDAITLERKTYGIPEEAIDETLKTITERNPRLVRAREGSKAKSGQVVVIDFKGMIGGVPFEGGTAGNFKLELGSGQFIEGFEDQLIGLKEGDDKVVTVTFPKNYRATDLAGKEAKFEVKIKEINDREVPEIDDAFAKSLGVADAETLRNTIRGQLIREYDGLVRNQLKKDLFDILEEKCRFDLPQGMVDLEFNTIWQRLKESQASGSEPVNSKGEDKLKEEYQQIARRRVKLGLLLADIGNRQKFQITREEISQAVWQQASQFPGQEKKVMEFYQSNPERLEELKGPIIEEKAVDFILSKVKFNDRKVSLEALRAGDSEEDGDEESDKSSQKTDKAKPKKEKTEDAEKETVTKPKARKKAAGE